VRTPSPEPRTPVVRAPSPEPRSPRPGPRYCELHAHTAFSFLEGANEPEALAERAAEIGLPAVAVADRGGVYGIPRFHKAAKAAGIEAIVGAEAVLEDGSRLPLLVQSARGWSNLCRLLTDGALGRPGLGARGSGLGLPGLGVRGSGFAIPGFGARDSGLEKDRCRSRIPNPEPRTPVSEPRTPVSEPRAPRLAVRLGLRFVKGLRAETALRIEAEAAKAPFASVREVAARCALRDDELSALAEVGAFSSLGQTRRSALWQVSALDGRRPPLAQAMQPDPGESPLPEMTLSERYVADYRGAGMTVGRHPLAMRRAELAARGILSAAELARVRDGALVRVGGAVIVRQRPYTAKGMCFMTLEDETGFANVAVAPQAFELQRAVITGSALLEVEGRAQARDGVVTVLAGRCAALFATAPVPPSRDFH